MLPSPKPAFTSDVAVPPHASFCHVADPSSEADHEHSSLVLPKGFIRRFHTYLLEILTLEAPNGQMWKVSLETDRQKGLQITTEWREVARYLHVESGDLLVFDLVSKGHFRIFIYDGEEMCERDIYSKRNTCESGAHDGDPMGMRKCGKKQKIELGEKNKVHQYSSNDHKNMEHDTRYQAITTTMVDKKNCKRTVEDIDTENENDCIPNKARHANGNGKHCSSDGNGNGKRGSSDANGKGKHRSSDANGNGEHGFLDANGKHGYGSLELVPYRANRSHKQRFTMQALHALFPKFHKETQVAFKNSLAYSSRNPFIILAMTHSNVCHGFKLAFPVSFAKQYMIAEAAQAVLIDTDNKAWSITWLGSNNYSPCLSGGWKHFVVDHGLKCGDLCILELISTKSLPTFKVFIFSVNPNDAPTIRDEVPAKLSSTLARNLGSLAK